MKCIGLIGQHLTHSYSPMIHSMIGDYEYRLCAVEPEELEHLIKTTELDGFNVTIPYKKDVVPFCVALTPAAKVLGSVNTMLRLPEGGFLGDNTDIFGFTHLLGDDAEAFRGRKALVLGGGGASASVCAVLEEKQIPYKVISRRGEDNYNNLERHRDATLIVNATPVGMFPENGVSPIDLRLFPDCRLVLDLIYNPARTELIMQAEDFGIRCRSGLGMLTAQAVRSGEIFLGEHLSAPLADSIASRVALLTQNIVLIGMPGCGKTTVGQELSSLTSRAFLDTDEMVRERAGMSITDIFKTHGEGYFRKIETEALREASKQSGLIIATGGGVVTIPENRNLIRQNSVCLSLTRDIEKLETEERPLSLNRGNEALERERRPLYEAWSQRNYHNDDSRLTAKKIKEDFGL